MLCFICKISFIISPQGDAGREIVETSSAMALSHSHSPFRSLTLSCGFVFQPLWNMQFIRRYTFALRAHDYIVFVCLFLSFKQLFAHRRHDQSRNVAGGILRCVTFSNYYYSSLIYGILFWWMFGVPAIEPPNDSNQSKRA